MSDSRPALLAMHSLFLVFGVSKAEFSMLIIQSSGTHPARYRNVDWATEDENEEI